MSVTTAEVLAALPNGFIVGWYKETAIPRGWFLCDGNNNTPNLIGKFPMGAASGEELKEHGGTVNHSHVVNQLTEADGWNADDMNRNKNPKTTGYAHTHLTSTVEHLPPYQKIIFIMKG